MEINAFKAAMAELSRKANDYSQSNKITNEAQTRNYIVEPFLKTLGYNCEDPCEVIPEYTAERGIKLGEKVDYAIMKDDIPVIIIECKKISNSFVGQDFDQTYRYFAALPGKCKFTILTNGIFYRFYTDFDIENVMDTDPIFVFDLRQILEEDYDVLQYLHKDNFQVENFRGVIGNSKIISKISLEIEKEFDSPCREFNEFWIRSIIYPTRVTEDVYNSYVPLIKKALDRFLVP